jgi:hypothetical protein
MKNSSSCLVDLISDNKRISSSESMAITQKFSILASLTYGAFMKPIVLPNPPATVFK